MNIFGTGKRLNKTITIIGEAKATLSKRQTEDFVELVEHLRKEVFPLMVTYSVEPDFEDFAREKGINIIWSYEI